MYRLYACIVCMHACVQHYDIILYVQYMFYVLHLRVRLFGHWALVRRHLESYNENESSIDRRFKSFAIEFNRQSNPSLQAYTGTAADDVYGIGYDELPGPCWIFYPLMLFMRNTQLERL